MRDARGLSSLSPNVCKTVTVGCPSKIARRGVLNHLAVRRRTAGQGRALRSDRLGPGNASSSFQLFVGATGGGCRGAARKQLRKERRPWRFGSMARLRRRRVLASWLLLGSLPAHPHVMGYRTPHLRKLAREAGVTRRATWPQKGRALKARRGLVARGVCPCVDMFVAEVDKQCRAQRSACAHFTRFGRVRGRGL